MDLTPCPASPVLDCGGGDVGLRRFLEAARESEWCGDGIRDDVMAEMERLGLSETIVAVTASALLHVPADRFCWDASGWFILRQDAERFFPPGTPIPHRCQSAPWLPMTPAAMEAEMGALVSASIDEDKSAAMIARRIAWRRIRWGVTADE